MIDFHSHILPDIDDGSSSLEESLEMLKACKKVGADTVVLTPHCYHTQDTDIREFIRDRNEKYRILKAAAAKSGDALPDLRLGCELHLSKFHEKSAYLKELATEGTNYILLEMPTGSWKPEIYDTIYSVTLMGLRPVIAHIDRYLYGHKKDFHNLFSFDLVYQVNCDAFLMRGIKKQMPYLFESGAIHILGSDMHNLTVRTTKMAECKKRIIAKYGEEYLRFLESNSEKVLNNGEVEIRYFEKMGFFKRLFL